MVVMVGVKQERTKKSMGVATWRRKREGGLVRGVDGDSDYSDWRKVSFCDGS